MEILFRVWDDLHKKLLTGFKIISDETGVNLDVSGCNINGEVYNDRFIIEPYTNRKDHKEIQIFEGDVMLPIDDPENPGDFILLESEVKYYDGCWILEEITSGKFKPMYELDQKDFKIKDHVDYKNYFAHNNSKYYQYINLSNESVRTAFDFNNKLKIWCDAHDFIDYLSLDNEKITGLAVIWYNSLHAYEQRAIKFDFGYNRSDVLTPQEQRALFVHYIINKKMINSFSPDTKNI